MFGGKKGKEEAPIVPVFTVQSLPRKYEVIETVYTEAKGFGDNDVAAERLLKALGEAGAAVGGDAVIGLLLYPSGYYGHTKGHFVGFGTAVKYVD